MAAVGFKVEDLTLKRGGRTVLNGISFDLLPREIVAVIGPNGAGKTSLLEGILGFLPLEHGRISFAGRELRTLSSRASIFSFMPESAEPPSEVGLDVLIEHAIRFGKASGSLAEDLIARLGLAPLRDARPAELSRGERRRVLLFIGLCTSRPVVVLDEPLGAFDPLQLIEVLDILRGRARDGSSILLSVHQISDAEKIADRVLLLDEGRVSRFSTIDELAAQAHLFDGSLEEIVVKILQDARAGA